MALIDTFTDNFNVGATYDASKWVFDNLGLSGTATQSGGNLVLNSGTTTAFNGDCFLDMITAYDLTGSSAYIKLVTPASYAGNISMNECGFRLRGAGTPGSEYIGFFQASTLEFWCVASNVTSGLFHASTFTFSPTTHVWLRMRESGGTIYWDTASSAASNPPASGDWTNRSTLAVSSLGWAGSGIATVKARLFYRLVATAASNQEVKFDGFNTGAGSGASTYNDSRTEAATITHSQTTTMTAVTTRTELATATETQTAVLTRVGALTETATVTDTSVSVIPFTRDVTETAAITDSAVSGQALGVSITETAALTDSQSVQGYWETVDTTQTMVWTQVPT